MKSETKSRYPAEWEPHEACWLAWPSDQDLWREDFDMAKSEFAELCKGIASGGEKLKLLVRTNEDQLEAKIALGHLSIEFFKIPYGDIWLRDTAPLFTLGPDHQKTATIFRFNGWGQKYLLNHDPEVASRIAEASKIPTTQSKLIFEGGSIEVDGQGTALTTEQCLLNKNRNPQWNKESIEAELSKNLGITKWIWLKKGLLNDHTDGHIDTLARFIAPNRVVCMSPSKNDPNQEILYEIEETISQSHDHLGRRIEVHTIPSPGRVYDRYGQLMPASYVNFYIANEVVLVPQYGSEFDLDAVEALQQLFSDRQVIGLPAKGLLSGGGAFHCITQQEPLVKRLREG